MSQLDRLLTLSQWRLAGAALLQVLQNPRANTQAFLLFIAAVALAAILLITAAVVLLAGTDATTDDSSNAATSESAAGSGDGQPKTRGARGTIVGGILVAVLVTAALLVATVYSGSDAVCTRACHSGVPVAGDMHAHTHCVDCHEPPGIYRLTALPQRFEHLVREISGGTSGFLPVSSRSCAACHAGAIANTAVARGVVRVSHAEPNRAGIPCTSCHSVSHGSLDAASASTRGAMGSCLSCHDGKVASAACPTCHIGDPSAAADASATESTIARIGVVAQVDCYICHGPARCDACHGIRMPHSAAFKSGGHAMQGAFDGRQHCVKCHDAVFCNRCHHFPGHSFASWKTQHGVGILTKNGPPNASCACHMRQPGETLQTFCRLCHATIPPAAYRAELPSAASSLATAPGR